MLYFLVAFIAFSAFKQWNPIFDPQTHTRRSDHARPSTYPLHGYRYTRPYAMYGTFPNLDPTLDDNSLGSIWQLYYVAAGRKTHNPGCKTHSAGHMTQHNCLSNAITAQHLVVWPVSPVNGIIILPLVAI